MKTGSLIRLGRALCLTVAFCGLASIAFAQGVFVDINAPSGGDGSNHAPFNSIETAVAYANGLSGTPTIRVAAGRYPVSATLVIQKGMILRGSNRMLTDSDGFPTGADPQTESRIVGTAALGANLLVSIGANNGQTISPIDIRQLTFEAGPGTGVIMQLTGVQDFTIGGSVFVGSTTLPQPARGIGLLTNASSGEMRGNYLRGLTAGAILRGSRRSLRLMSHSAITGLSGITTVASFLPEPATELSIRATSSTPRSATTTSAAAHSRPKGSGFASPSRAKMTPSTPTSTTVTSQRMSGTIGSWTTSSALPWTPASLSGWFPGRQQYLRHPHLHRHFRSHVPGQRRERQHRLPWSDLVHAEPDHVRHTHGAPESVPVPPQCDLFDQRSRWRVRWGEAATIPPRTHLPAGPAPPT